MLKKPNRFGLMVRKAHEEREMSLDELAAAVSVPVEAVAAIEDGFIHPSGTMMARLAQALGTTVQCLILGASEDKSDWPFVPKPRRGMMEVCQFCDTSYHPMLRYSVGGTVITVCHEQACKDQAFEHGFEPRPDLTPRR